VVALRKRVLVAAVAMLAVAALVGAVALVAPPRVSRDLRRLTGVRTRVVWCRQVAGGASDVLTEGSQLMLMGLDTSDCKGPHPLLSRVGSYSHPLITPSGTRVVYTDHPGAKICVVNWDGSGLRDVSAGYALDVWRDPASGQEWVYALDARTLDRNGAGSPVVRIDLDCPSKRQTVWDATPVTIQGFNVSSDGTHASGGFPWPRAGIANLADGTLREVGRGCWSGLDPDGANLLWIFDSAHRHLRFYDLDGQMIRTVNVNDILDLAGYEAHHPRWGNHGRIISLTGPYKEGDGPGCVRGGGKAVEVWVGRFDAEFTRIEAWVRVTHDRKADFCPETWVESAR
jgi:hypothetical protein